METLTSIIEKYAFLENIELDAWILARVLMKNGKINCRYEIACIISNINLILYYSKRRNNPLLDADKRLKELIEEVNKCIDQSKCNEDELIKVLQEYKDEYIKKEKRP
mgnify:CR=1 FL=1